MKGQVGMLRAVGRFSTSILIVTLLAGTAWTGRASVARVDVDPALHSGDVALIQVAAGTAWTVAHDLTTAGATEVTVFDGIDIVSAHVGDAALTAIGTDRSVLRATTDATVVAAGGGPDSGLDELGDSSKALSVGNAAIHAPTAWSRSTGAGVVVALMDSGIGRNPDLSADKVVTRVNFVADNATSLDPAGHGTHLAGIIAANGETFRGVAPDARLVDLRVLDKNGNGRLRDVVGSLRATDGGPRGGAAQTSSKERGKVATSSLTFDPTFYARMSGTSVSSAMVACVAALVRSYHPDYSPTKIKAAVLGSGRSITGSPREAVEAAKALTATERNVNKDLLPSRLLMQTLAKSGVTGSGTTWEGITWEGVTWEAITWESVTWEAVTWESVSWEGVMWETVGPDPLLGGPR